MKIEKTELGFMPFYERITEGITLSPKYNQYFFSAVSYLQIGIINCTSTTSDSPLLDRLKDKKITYSKNKILCGDVILKWDDLWPKLITDLYEKKPK